jgi:iron complex transport system substrate-binding protein
VVSLNLCTDQLLLTLAPEQAIAVSKLARDPALSVVAAQAAGVPAVAADAEAVLALHPDLVLAGEYGAQGVLGLLRARGVRVVQIAEPADFAGVEAAIGATAAVLGVPARGQALVARMRAELGGIHPVHHGTAIFWQARGYTSGPGGFGDALLRRAGYTNVGTGGQMALEALLTHPPQLLVTEAAPAYPSLATDMLTHPALAGLARRSLAPASLACPGPWSVAALRVLAE